MWRLNFCGFVTTKLQCTIIHVHVDSYSIYYLVPCLSQSRQDWHRNLEAAIQHHSTTLGKYPAISTVDSHGKVSVACTYSES